MLSPTEKQLKGPSIDLLLGADDSNPLRLSFLCDLGKAVNPTLSAFTRVLVGIACVGVAGVGGGAAGQHSSLKVQAVWVWIVSPSLGQVPPSLQPIWKESYHELALG